MMIFRTILLAAVAAQATADHSPDSRRLLNMERIIGYLPRTLVTDHAAIDLDQQKIVEQLSMNRITKAKNVYEQGGFSASYADITVVDIQGKGAFMAGTRVIALDPQGRDVAGTVMETVEWDAALNPYVSVPVQYAISNVQSIYVNCQVGGLFTFEEANRDGCFNMTGQIDFISDDDARTIHEYKYDIRLENKNARTLQKLSTEAINTMRPCPVCPYFPDFKLFLNYYGDEDYANIWVESAAVMAPTAFEKSRGNADFSAFDVHMPMGAAIETGTVTLNLWMAVVRELEMAVSFCKVCKSNDGDCDDPMHPLDVAVAYYAGSLEGQDGAGNGNLLFALANEGALAFKTGGETGGGEIGTAYVNLEIRRQLQKAQLALLQENCESADANIRVIVNLMKVPIIQGALEIAYIRAEKLSATDEDDEEDMVMGATFAASILPYLHECNTEAADIIYRNMRVGSARDDVSFSQVKKAFESQYACLGVTCADVGGIYVAGAYAPGAEPCGVVNMPGGINGGGGGKAGSWFLGIIVILLAGGLTYFAYDRRNQNRQAGKGHPKRRPSMNLSPVAEIS